ncbi:uncharacterized protein LOC112050980 [Bicyclus anynana]|uniref:Uncharacterized protein LOC112050980 n=1 Tax=Bicyclus anynana TaxID=110368 RepID=A0ABM3LEK1_BICAN|nr:uncharacterized protein LOC112050980 [Bicyclus anynana]
MYRMSSLVVSLASAVSGLLLLLLPVQRQSQARRSAAPGAGGVGRQAPPPRALRVARRRRAPRAVSPRRASCVFARVVFGSAPRHALHARVQPAIAEEREEWRFASYRAALESCHFLILSGKDVVRAPRSSLRRRGTPSDTTSPPRRAEFPRAGETCFPLRPAPVRGRGLRVRRTPARRFAEDSVALDRTSPWN